MWPYLEILLVSRHIGYCRIGSELCIWYCHEIVKLWFLLGTSLPVLWADIEINVQLISTSTTIIFYLNLYYSTYSLAYAIIWCVGQIPQVITSTLTTDLSGSSSSLDAYGTYLGPTICARPNLIPLRLCALGPVYISWL